MSDTRLSLPQTGPAGLDPCFADRGRNRRRLGVRTGLAAAAAVALGAFLAMGPGERGQPPVFPESPPRKPDWVDLLQASPDIRLAEASRDAQGHVVQAHEPGGGRRDIITAKGPDGVLRLVLYRPGQERTGSTSFHLDMARLAAEAGFAVLSSGLAESLPTRFGPFEASEIRLVGEGGERNCTGFRSFLERDGQRLILSGYSCGAGAEAPDRKATACRINRLEASATAPQELKRFLGAAPRKACDAPRSAAVSATGR